ncbi:MAG: multicopper oxidase domain-containing protein [Acidobacteria bacterium]|nr:multicopper oxidase domain-containing protein [Acidobacteriota bacterium]
MNHTNSRREFLRVTGISAAALATNVVPVSLFSPSANAAFDEPDVILSLRAVQADIPMFSRQTTRVWMYQGEVLKGDPNSLQTLDQLNESLGTRRTRRRDPVSRTGSPVTAEATPPSTYLGPIMRVRSRQRIRINFTNQLPEATVMHWHGLHVPPEMDAHPSYLVQPGQSYVYEFAVANRAGTYWFHPHPDGRTARQVYNGLAGLFIVTDEEDAATGLPTGKYDLPLVLQDRMLDAANQFVYQTGGGMMGNDGFLGDRFFVNGKPDFLLTLERRAYRLRLLNGSNARVYKLAWDDGTPLTVIGTDGGLLERAMQRSYVMLAPGERIELWADFSGRPVDSILPLRSLQFSGAEVGMGGGGQTLPNGAAFTVMKVQVTGRTSETGVLPTQLSTLNRNRIEDAINRNTPRSFAVSMGMISGGMRWLLNGRPYQESELASNEIVQLNTTEVWELSNTNTGGMSMVHPIHIHGLQFQVLERTINSQFAAGWETVRYGYVDDGWKDTVMIMPGERVKVLLRFEDFTGMYVYHCHNLEHEDAGMMRNYQVRA